jgi:hypothetical protein
MASSNSKKTRPKRAERQWGRTARNTDKRRDRHEKAHPNDAAAKANWKASPVKRSK